MFKILDPREKLITNSHLLTYVSEMADSIGPTCQISFLFWAKQILGKFVFSLN
jgi:hypothetical protein